jgi:glycosyltransferase involved in cell wall biosynthesis
METVAVVIPAYNHARYVAEAIASAASQGECVSEIVVVDDGSTDDTAKVVESINEPRLRLMRQPNQGPSPARNRGWRSTRAEWLFFLDADDAISPGALPALLAAAASHGKRVIPYGYQEIYAQTFSGPPHFQAFLSKRTGSVLPEVASGYPGTIWVALVPRVWVEEIGGFDEQDGKWRGEDFDFALRLAIRFAFLWVNRPVIRTRMHDSNRHRDFGASASLDYIRSIRRAFRGRWNPRERWLRQKGLAYYHMERAFHLHDSGQRREASAAFRQAWISFPPRLGNLRRWISGC